MRPKILFIVLIILLVVSGCGKTDYSKLNDDPQEPVVFNTGATKDLYQGWSNDLQILADRTGTAYGEWTTGKIDNDAFTQKMNQLFNETKVLGEKQLTFKAKLNDSDKEKYETQFDAINSAYLKAKKDLAEFQYRAPRYVSDKKQVQATYDEWMKDKYANHIKELDGLLAK